MALDNCCIISKLIAFRLLKLFIQIVAIPVFWLISKSKVPTFGIFFVNLFNISLDIFNKDNTDWIVDNYEDMSDSVTADKFGLARLTNQND